LGNFLLFVIKELKYGSPSVKRRTKMPFGRIAIIPIEGPIGGIYFPFLTYIMERNFFRMERCLEEAKKSRRIKVVILKINLPGGKVYPCRRLVKTVKQIKTFTVDQIEEIGTSD